MIEEIVRIYANSKYLDRNVRWVLFILAEYMSLTYLNLLADLTALNGIRLNSGQKLYKKFV